MPRPGRSRSGGDDAGRDGRRAVRAARVSIVSWALRPLGFGTTHSSAPADGSGWRPSAASRPPNAVAVGRDAGDRDDARPVLGDERDAARSPPARSSAGGQLGGPRRGPGDEVGDPDAARRRGRRGRRRSCPSPRSIAPVDHAGPQQRRVEAVAGVGEVGLRGRGPQPGVDARRTAAAGPGPTRSGTSASRNDSSSARREPHGGDGYGAVADR